ncbi:MAG TPA: glycosyltransferase, partial [Acidimicrobiales bacterium]|nr:glycosyltransferase [Acidimicrobiales bacterium]
MSRRVGWDGHDDVGAYVGSAVRCMTTAGHHVFLVTEGPVPPSARLPPEVEVVQVAAGDPKVHHFSELHQYADRVYRTLESLGRRARLDAVEFSQDRAEGFTAIRAKRTLGRFAATTLVVCVHAPRALARQVTGYGPTDFREEIRSFAEDYCLAHADTVVVPTASLAAYVEERVARTPAHVPYLLVEDGGALADGDTLEDGDTLVDGSAGDGDGGGTGGGSDGGSEDGDGAGPVGAPGERPPELLYLGGLSPERGADVFVEVAAHVAAAAPQFRFRMIGPDSPSDPLGRSYRAHLDARMPAEVAARLRFEPLPPAGDVRRAIPPFSLCLFPARRDDSPYALLEAMRRRAAVLVSRHGGMPEVVEGGTVGLVVDPTDPGAVARAVLRLHGDRAAVERLGTAARRTVLRRSDPEAYRARMRTVHGDRPAGPRPRPVARRPPVSVVVPVFDQARYLGETVRSVQASHYGDLEIVVVDDGSTDPQVAKELAALDDVVVVSHASNRGVAAARNTGIAASSGRFVMPLDADDLIHPSYIPSAVQALTRNPDLAYVGCYSQNFGLLDTTYVPVGFVPNLMLVLHT